MASWEGIREFTAVAETSSFTAAAARLEVSVAHISRQIVRLESRLDVKLFHRTTRTVMTTEEGRVYYQHCRQVLDGLEEAERAITNLQSQPSGKLRMTAPFSYGEKYIAPLVNDFLLHHPKLEVELHLTNQRLDLIEEGVDLAIRVGLLGDARLVARKLGAREQYLCASPDYVSRKGEPRTLSDLDGYDCLLGTLDYWRFNDNGRARNIKVKGRMHCNNGPALLDAALKGLGLVQLPDYYVEEYLQQGALVSVLDTHRPAQEGIWALYPQNRHLSPKVRLLIEFFRERLDTVG